MVKLYIALGLISALLAAFWLTYREGHKAGESEATLAAVAAQEELQKAFDERLSAAARDHKMELDRASSIVAEKQEKEIEIREVVRTVYVEAPKIETECAALGSDFVGLWNSVLQQDARDTGRGRSH